MSSRIFLVSVFIFFAATFTVVAQKDRVLFTINGDKVYSSEFTRVYEKNLAIVNDDTQKDISNYLDLFINYKLKLQEAYDLKMDTIPSYIREFNKYKNQLIQPYLKDENTEKDLVKEAYNRSLYEINASHILVRLPKRATPKDTLKAYNKIKEARKRILSGEKFEDVAKQISEDPSAKKNGGNLGYFTVFQMVYPFETAAYTTPVGEVSEPFKTRFGYHIVKVNDKRKALGDIEVAHIMLKGINPKNEELIFNIKEQLDKGISFETLAAQFSQDKATAKKGGKLPKFTSGKMIKEFSDVAFSLTDENNISKPFKTAYGWHIIKLIKKYPIESFDKMQTTLKKKVEQGQRAKIIGNSILKRLSKEYIYATNKTLVKRFKNTNWKDDTILKGKITFLSIQDKLIPVRDFYDYYLKQEDLDFNTVLKKFKEEETLKYYKEHLNELYPEYAYTLREYKEGLLLFDLMQKRIWEKAEKDSIGLQRYYQENSDKYQWKDRAKAIIITSNSSKIADKIVVMLEKGIDADSIKNKFSSDELIVVEQGVYEKEDAIFPKETIFSKGISKPVKVKDQYVVVVIEEIFPATTKKLNDIRGKVISDYQDYLEKKWIEALKARYPVEVNNKSLKKIKLRY